MKRYHVETTPDSDYDLSRHFDYIYTNLQNMTVVPGTSGGARAAEPLASFFVAEDDSLTVVPGTRGWFE